MGVGDIVFFSLRESHTQRFQDKILLKEFKNGLYLE